jgi:expansin (peptidoglycan-binding protein)
MAICCNPAVKKQLSPALLKLLKGKSCFYVKQLTPELKRDISGALEISYDGYRKLGSI